MKVAPSAGIRYSGPSNGADVTESGSKRKARDSGTKTPFGRYRCCGAAHPERVPVVDDLDISRVHDDGEDIRPDGCHARPVAIEQDRAHDGATGLMDGARQSGADLFQLRPADVTGVQRVAHAGCARPG